MFSEPNWWLVIVGAFTAGVVGWQAWETRKAAEATRASVELGKETAKRQLRAYITVVIGPALFQEREKNLRFDARPIMVNAGQTPAHKITFVIKAAILPVPLPRETGLSETGNLGVGDSILGGQHNASMGAVVDGFCQDEDVEKIKAGDQQALYVWGIISYEDIFKEKHQTRFCQQIYWIGKTVNGCYTPGRNEAT